MSGEFNFDQGTAGAGARREYERRKARREARVRAAHPHVGGALLKLQGVPQHERAWAAGAAGEEAVARHLSKTCPNVRVLHDRQLPGRRSNIDHLAVAASGVWVIDAKRYKGKIEVRKPLFGDATLVIAGRDKTKLVEGLERQIAAVRAGLAIIEREVPIHGCFCFINPAGQSGGTDIPLFRTLTIKCFPLLVPRKLTKRLNAAGPVSVEETNLLAEALAELFPPA